MSNKLSKAGMIVAGLALILVTFGYLMFWRTAPFEGLTADFRPLMTAESVAQMQTDITDLEAASTEYRTALVPAVAQRLGVAPAALEAQFAQQFPATTTGMNAIPQIAAGMRSLAATFDAERARFTQADAIPTKDQTTTSIPWLLTGAGILALIVAFSATRRRGTAVAAIVLGVALAGAPLVISMPSKAAAADQLNANLAPVFTSARVVQTQQAVSTLEAMTSEITTTMLPAIASQLQLPADQVNAFLGKNFPALAATLQNAPQALARAQSIAAAYAENLPRYEDIKPVSFRVITWTTILAGFLLIVAGAAAFGSAAQIATLETRERRWVGRRRQAA
ncbi:MAG TPA: hypothetical protein VGB64_04235 [Actinomycetota bacterium]